MLNDLCKSVLEMKNKLEIAEEEYNESRQIYSVSCGQATKEEVKNLEEKKHTYERILDEYIRYIGKLREETNGLKQDYAAVIIEMKYVQEKSNKEIAYNIDKPSFYVKRVIKKLEENRLT